MARCAEFKRDAASVLNGVRWRVWDRAGGLCAGYVSHVNIGGRRLVSLFRSLLFLPAPIFLFFCGGSEIYVIGWAPIDFVGKVNYTHKRRDEKEYLAGFVG